MGDFYRSVTDATLGTLSIGNKNFESVFFTGDLCQFLIEWINLEDNYYNFIIYKVIAWSGKIPNEYEEYLSASVKWGGCSDIYFKELHFCGKTDFDNHCKLIQLVIYICSRRMKYFDLKIAGYEYS